MLTYLQQLGAHSGGWLYAIAGLLTFAEVAAMIGLILPGETALLVAGFAAQQGWISLWPMVAISVAAAVAGDNVGYLIGRSAGPWMRRSFIGRRIGPARWQSADAFLGRHGGKAVLLGRFVAMVRTLTPAMAGMARMPYLRTFLPWNLAGGLVWGAGSVLLGYTFSTSLAVIGHYVTYGSLLLLGPLVAIVIVRLRRCRRATAVPADAKVSRDDEHALEAAELVSAL